jgi:hypothetical protein
METDARVLFCMLASICYEDNAKLRDPNKRVRSGIEAYRTWRTYQMHREAATKWENENG